MKKLIFILYFLLLLLFTIFSYAFIDPNLFYLKRLYSGFAFQNRAITTIIFIGFISFLFVFYFSFLQLLNKKILNIHDIKWLIGMTTGILFFSYPAMLSYDIFNYIATAKVLFFYHENPYIIMPIEFTSDPLLLFTHAANKIALYGPVWIGLTSLPHFVNFGNFIPTFFSFKLFIVPFYVITAYLLWKLSKNIFSVALFALNPLVIIETLVSSHNDIVMMFFALFSFYSIMKKKVLQGILFLILSVFIKYATIFLIPVFIYIALKTLQKQKVDWERIWIISTLLMLVAFFLSPIREEIYPWYAIWFLLFTSLIYSHKLIIYFSIAFSLSLLLRYIPLMLWGTHFGLTPILKTFLTFVPPFFVLTFIIIKEHLWSKTLFR